MVTMPGVFTPTEALAACAAGRLGAQVLSGQRARSGGDQRNLGGVAEGCPVGAVGGVSNADFAAYAKVGIRTFGLGSSLYKAAWRPTR
jgi:2-dehydro-3-deoxyphosphogalactonate aldolase